MGDLQDLIAAELAQPVDARVRQAAGTIAAAHPGARAVLFYGSCLRTGEIDGQMLDFYLIVSDYRQAYGKRWLAWANQMIPPNVFPFERNGVAAKYAVLSEDHLRRECSVAARSPSVWARFAQPVRLVWAADDNARTTVRQAVASAPSTFLELVRPTMTNRQATDVLQIWREGFTLTYGSELRAERSGRPDAIVDQEPARYAKVANLLGFPRSDDDDARARQSAIEAWRQHQRRGKRLTLLRLAKASLTFAGGVDYLAWKINRHADAGIVVKPWQRRWPLLGALILLPRLLRRGAVR
ncbi:hypothetical protein ACFSCW_03865 [Sphingomonas tabacisoli]|uniref:Phosphatidate cytidylyltransferase n=1 Tax=Sphingomonas tabacisoli TaxID=2249466 RepID=A0ABW4I085_9SPHN